MIEGPGPLTPAAHSRAEIEGGFFFSSASAFHDRKPAFAVFSVRCPVPFLLGDHIFPSIFRFFFPLEERTKRSHALLLSFIRKRRPSNVDSTFAARGNKGE